EGGFGVPFNIVGRAPSSGRYDGRGWIPVSARYFDVFKIPLVRGRVFSNLDDFGPLVAIINQQLARQFWPHGDPLGERIILGHGYGPEVEDPGRQIVGIVGDVPDFGLNRNRSPMVYVPLAQVPDGITALASRASGFAWIVRTRVEPHSLAPSIERELRQVTGGLPIARIHSMDEIRSQSTARADFNMSLLTVFAAAALRLAVIGIYGLMAYTVEQRSQEIGIRLALGANGGDVRNMIVAEGMRLAISGTAIGIALALALSRLLAGFLLAKIYLTHQA